MNAHEFYRLLDFHKAKMNRPTTNIVTRRAMKAKRVARGQILSGSRVVSRIGLEKLFVNETVKQRMIAEAP